MKLLIVELTRGNSHQANDLEKFVRWTNRYKFLSPIDLLVHLFTKNYQRTFIRVNSQHFNTLFITLINILSIIRSSNLFSRSLKVEIMVHVSWTSTFLKKFEPELKLVVFRLFALIQNFKKKISSSQQSQLKLAMMWL